MCTEKKQGLVMRVTTITDMVDGEVINTESYVEYISKGDSEEAVEEDNYQQSLSIEDAFEIISSAMKVRIGNDYEQTLKMVRRACIQEMHIIALDRDINYSTVFSNVIRRCDIPNAKTLYKGLTNYLMYKDTAIVNAYLSITKNHEQQQTIMEAFTIQH